MLKDKFWLKSKLGYIKYSPWLIIYANPTGQQE